MRMLNEHAIHGQLAPLVNKRFVRCRHERRVAAAHHETLCRRELVYEHIAAGGAGSAALVAGSCVRRLKVRVEGLRTVTLLYIACVVR